MYNKDCRSDESSIFEEAEVTHEMWQEWSKSFRQRSLSHSESDENNCESCDDYTLMPAIKKQRLGVLNNFDVEHCVKKTSGK